MQNVQDFFAQTMGVALLSYDGNKRLTKPSKSSDFCSKYTRGSELGCKLCDECHLKGEKEASLRKEPVIFKCHAGLTNFAIPTIIEGEHIASLVGGQILTEPKDKNHFKKLAEKLGIDEDEYLEEASKLNVIPPENFQAIVDALFLITNSICTISYANFQLSELGLNYKIPRNIAMEEWFFLNCEKIKRPISSREFEVLKLIVLGKSNTEIAKELVISVHTAKAHVSSILEKLLVEDRVQVAVKAVREGLV